MPKFLKPHAIVHVRSRQHTLVQVFLNTLFCFLLALLLTTNAARATEHDISVLVVGDSISAEYGLERGSGWVKLLESKLQSERPHATVINSSISGDTSAGGKARLGALLKKHQPTHVIIELGANDALRGLSLTATLKNLTTMSVASQQAGAKVLITGMQMPPNYGPTYQKQFRSVFEKAAKDTDAALLPFLLTGVADIEADKSWELFQKDLIHPNEAAQPAMMDNVWNALSPLLPESKNVKIKNGG